MWKITLLIYRISQIESNPIVMFCLITFDGAGIGVYLKPQTWKWKMHLVIVYAEVSIDTTDKNKIKNFCLNTVSCIEATVKQCPVTFPQT